MYVIDYLKTFNMPYHYKGKIRWFIRYQNQQEYKEVDTISPYRHEIIPNYFLDVSISSVWNQDKEQDLLVFFTLKVRSFFTLKEFLDRIESPIQETQLKDRFYIYRKGDKRTYFLNPVTFMLYKDYIVRRVRYETQGRIRTMKVWIK